MKTKFLKFSFFTFICLITISFANAQVNKNVVLDGLRCCNMLNPEGIDIPLLSWKIITNAERISQNNKSNSLFKENFDKAVHESVFQKL